MKRNLIFSMIIAILILAPQIAISTDETKDYTPELISTLDLSDYFSYARKISINGDYALVQGSLMIGERKHEYHSCIVDISDLKKPIFIKDIATDELWGMKCFYKDYAYGIEGGWKAKTLKIHVIDFHDPANPELVNTIDSFSHWTGNAVIVGDRLLVTETKRGVMSETKIYLYSLDDPANPELITDKFYDALTKDECSFLPYMPLKLYTRDNIIYLVSFDSVQMLYINDDKISLSGILKQPYDYISSFSYIDETMDRNFLFCFMTGSVHHDLKYQDEIDPDSNRRETKDGLSVMLHDIKYEHINSFSMIHRQSIRLPIDIRHVIQNRTIAYVFGSKLKDSIIEAEKATDYEEKFLIVDFTMQNAPVIMKEITLDSFTGAVTRSNDLMYRMDNNGILSIYKIPECTAEFGRITTTKTEYKPSHFDARFVENPTEKSIEQILRMEIDKPDGTLTKDDFKDIKQLNLEAAQITSLDGIELCSNLEELNIDFNYISDITPLGELKALKNLDLRSNRLENLEPLSKLKNLEILNLSESKITNIDAILELDNLEELIISGNRDMDISGLSRLRNLKKLDIASVKTKDLSFIETMTKLEYLDISFNEISDFTPLTKLKKLEHLKVSRNLTMDYSKLAELRNLKTLDIHGSKVSDISFLKNLPKLEILDLSDNRVSDISVLENLKELTSLKLRRNKTTDLSPLLNLTKLESLELSKNNIEDISPLANLTNLTKSLDLSENKIMDISTLSKLTKLEVLRISDNQITDITPIRDMTALKVLRISNNQISDISPLASHKTLKSITLDNNQITDISAIINIPNLNSAVFTHNKISDASPLLNFKSKDIKLVVFLHDNEMDENSMNELNRKLHGSNIILGPNRNEQHCVNSLASFIECSTELKDKRNDKTYGTWNDITDAYMASKEHKLNDYVPRYKVVLFNVKPATMKGGKVIRESTITILVVPKEKSDNLRTFAITQDMEVLEWIGDYELKDYSSLSLDNSKLWKKWPCGWYGNGGYSYHSG